MATAKEQIAELDKEIDKANQILFDAIQKYPQALEFVLYQDMDDSFHKQMRKQKTVLGYKLNIGALKNER